MQNDADWSDIALGVIINADRVNESRIDQCSLKVRVRLLHDERESIGRVSCGVIFTDRRTGPANLNDDVGDGLLNYDALALGERRMLDEREFDERIFFAARPIAEKLLRHLVNIFRLHVTRHHQR